MIYVGGGNTANMLAVWRFHFFDKALQAALTRDIILIGVSARSNCWFQSGVTDRSGGDLSPLYCQGFLPGSHCPHYNGEPNRRPAYQRFVGEGLLPGIAAENGAALHFVDGRLHRIVSSREDVRAHRVQVEGGHVQETLLNVD